MRGVKHSVEKAIRAPGLSQAGSHVPVLTQSRARPALLWWQGIPAAVAWARD